jgi:hypothetical protein
MDSEEAFEFWQDFDDLQFKLNPSRFYFDYSGSANNRTGDDGIKQHILNLRRVSRKEEKRVTITEKFETRETIKEAVDLVHQQLVEEVETMKMDNEEMVKVLRNKYGDVQCIAKYLVDSELMIMQKRVKFKPKPVVDNWDKQAIRLRELNKDIDLLKIALEAMKDGIKIYTKTVDDTNRKLEELKTQLIITKSTNESEIKTFQVEGNSRVAKGKAENIRFKEEFEKYKIAKLRELEQAELKCSSNKMTINNLQVELKNAKNILQHPVVKLRVHDTLKEYLNDCKGYLKPEVAAPYVFSAGFSPNRPQWASVSDDFKAEPFQPSDLNPWDAAPRFFLHSSAERFRPNQHVP